MKTQRIFTLLLLILSFTVLCAHLNAQSNTMKDKFYMGAFQCNMYWPFYFDHGIPAESIHFPYYSQLSYNMMQSYSYEYEHEPLHPPFTFLFDGGFYDDFNTYQGNLHDMLNQWKTHNTGQNSLILERCKVSMPAWGQRSTYQAEVNDVNMINWITKRPGYGYSQHPTGSTYDEYRNGETIRGDPKTWVL